MPVFPYIPLELICALSLSLCFCLQPFFLSVTHLIKYWWWMWYLRFIPHSHNVFLSFIHYCRASFLCALKHKNIYARLFCSVTNRKYALQNEKYFICSCHAMNVCVAVFLSLSIYKYNIFSLILGKWLHMSIE